MPGAPFPCLNTIQPIFGCDAHKTIPPPPPAPPPFAPHVVVWGVGWSQKTGFLWATTTSKASSPETGVPKPVQCGWGYAIGRTHDSGPHPGHIWANLLLPLILLASASKHEFGSGTVKVPGGYDKAIGVAWVMDLGLDCFDFPIPPCPTGFAITAANTVRAGFTWSDFFRGLIQMTVDALITWAISGALSVGGEPLSGGMRGALGRAFKIHSVFTANAPGFFARNGRFFVDAARAMRPALGQMFSRKEVAGTLINIAGPLVGTFLVGSPLGYAPNKDSGGSYSALYNQGPSGWVDGGINGLFR